MVDNMILVFSYWLLSEDGKIHAPVLAVFNKVGVSGEVIVLAMLKNKDSIGFY